MTAVGGYRATNGIEEIVKMPSYEKRQCKTDKHSMLTLHPEIAMKKSRPSSLTTMDNGQLRITEDNVGSRLLRQVFFSVSFKNR